MSRIIDSSGNVYEFNQETGLISKNNVILSGLEYEPVFVSHPDNSIPPIFVGILSKRNGTVLCMSGTTRRTINSRQL